MYRKWLVVAVGFVVISLFLENAEAQTSRIRTRVRAPEVLEACGDAGVTFNFLAQLMAPVYWFSPDEPLLIDSDGNRSISTVAIPAELPSPRSRAVQDRPQQRIVYYRISRLRVRDGVTQEERKSLERGPGIGGQIIQFDRISFLHIRYMSYYPRDVGIGQHPHDLEIVEVEFEIVPEIMGTLQCYSVRVSRIAGAAHGSDWYSNVLDVASGADDVVLPPHILVEEGKHASAPDRNADGWFTPGYDATLNANDAWGVRDTIRERSLRSRLYDPAQAKDRCSNPQISMSIQNTQSIFAVSEAPRSVRENPAVTYCFFDHHESADRNSYYLVEAGAGISAEYCDDLQVAKLPPDQHQLQVLLGKWNFCDKTIVRKKKGRLSWIADHMLAGPEGPGEATRRDRLTLAYRLAGGNGQVSRQMFSIVPGFGVRVSTIGGGWIVPRLSIGNDKQWTVDALYTPSGARIVDWYVAAGYERWNGPAGDCVVEEIGFKVRFPSGFLSPVNSLVGMRFGYRGNLHSRVAGGRFVFEVGLGGW